MARTRALAVRSAAPAPRIGDGVQKPVDYASTLKPAAVETPLDLFFFRPAGYAVVRAVLPTRITPNQLTLASIATGLVGAALSASPKRSLRIVGALFGIAYGVLDCADGQLARARGTSSRVGRILDGASDYIVGVATGLAVTRTLGRKHGRLGRWLAVSSVASIVIQGTLFDHAKNRYLARTDSSYREGDDLAETLLDLERLTEAGGPLLERGLLTLYTVFLRVQSGLAGARESEAAEPVLEGREAARLAELARAWAWLGPSTHVTLLAVFTAIDRVDLYALLRLFGANGVALWLRWSFQQAERGDPWRRDHSNEEAASHGSRVSARTRATWIALAEVVIPRGAWLPPASAATVDRLLTVLRDGPPSVAVGLSALLAILDAQSWLHHQTSFAASPAADRLALLARWRGGGAMARAMVRAVVAPIKAAHFDDPETYVRLGCVYERERPRAPSHAPAVAARIHRGEDLDADMTVEADVVVVGTGAGGAVVGKELAEAGFAVVFVEEGRYFDRRDFSGRPFAMQRALYRRAGTTFTMGNNLIPLPLGQTVGGSTTVNSGTCFRTPDRVLARWRDELGLSELGPDKLAPYYERVEAVLGIARARPELLGGNARIIARGCEALGLQNHGPLKRNAPDCDGKGVCVFGCPTDAKRSTNVSYIPMALRAGAELYAGCAVSRILVDGGRAVGVEARTASGRSLTVRARAVIVSGGAIMTPGILQRSGLGGGSGQLGRNLSIHPAAGLLAELDERIAGWDGIPQGYGIEDYRDEGILFEGATTPLEMTLAVMPHFGPELVRLAEGFDRVASFGFMVEDTSRGVVRTVSGQPWITYSLGALEIMRLRRGVEILSRIFFAAGAERVHTPVAGFETLSSLAELEALLAARLGASDFDLSAYHPLGTARMGRDASSSVVDSNHEVHDAPGLFVVDGSVMPSSIGVNPQITIMALATRAAERIASCLD